MEKHKESERVKRLWRVCLINDTTQQDVTGIPPILNRAMGEYATYVYAERYNKLNLVEAAKSISLRFNKLIEDHVEIAFPSGTDRDESISNLRKKLDGDMDTISAAMASDDASIMDILTPEKMDSLFKPLDNPYHLSWSISPVTSSRVGVFGGVNPGSLESVYDAANNTWNMVPVDPIYYDNYIGFINLVSSGKYNKDYLSTHESWKDINNERNKKNKKNEDIIYSKMREQINHVYVGLQVFVLAGDAASALNQAMDAIRNPRIGSSPLTTLPLTLFRYADLHVRHTERNIVMSSIFNPDDDQIIKNMQADAFCMLNATINNFPDYVDSVDRLESLAAEPIRSAISDALKVFIPNVSCGERSYASSININSRNIDKIIDSSKIVILYDCEFMKPFFSGGGLPFVGIDKDEYMDRILKMEPTKPIDGYYREHRMGQYSVINGLMNFRTQPFIDNPSPSTFINAKLLESNNGYRNFLLSSFHDYVMDAGNIDAGFVHAYIKEERNYPCENNIIRKYRLDHFVAKYTIDLNVDDTADDNNHASNAGRIMAKINILPIAVAIPKMEPPSVIDANTDQNDTGQSLAAG